MKDATVVIPFAYTPKWGQIVVASLKEFKNDHSFDIIVMNNTPDRKDIEALSNTRLGKDVSFMVPPVFQRWHAGALDYAIDKIETPYMFAIETDCTVDRNNWLDWYVSYMIDDMVAMAGWFWQVGEDIDDGRHYINSSATLYNSRILKMLLRECYNNKDTKLCYGLDYERRFDHLHSANIIKKQQMGPFSEMRGFIHQYPAGSLPDKWWHEPGSWLYNRASCQWQCVRIPGETISSNELGSPPQKYTYYGVSEEEAYAFHYWAGTVSHNFEKQLVVVPWEANCLEWWLRREHRLWEERVPGDVRKYSIEHGLVRSFEEDLELAKFKTHLLNPGDLVRVYEHHVVPYILKEIEEPKDVGSSAVVINWDHKGLLVQFEKGFSGKPKYLGLYKEDGIFFARPHPANCVKRG